MGIIEKVREGTRGAAALADGKTVLLGKKGLQQAMLHIHSH